MDGLKFCELAGSGVWKPGVVKFLRRVVAGSGPEHQDAKIVGPFCCSFLRTPMTKFDEMSRECAIEFVCYGDGVDLSLRSERDSPRAAFYSHIRLDAIGDPSRHQAEKGCPHQILARHRWKSLVKFIRER